MRARPVRFSVSTGLRLCGMADEPFWPGVEIFLGLQHFGALQMADLGGQPLDRRGDHAQGGEIGGVAVARDHLGRDRLDRQAHLLGDMLFHARIDIGEGADRAGDGAGGDLGARRDQPLAGAAEFGVVAGELQAEGGRLGMDAVAAADGRRHLVFEARASSAPPAAVDIGDQQVGGAGQLHGQAGVEHVGRGHALVHEARLGPDDLGQMGQEGDDVVLGLALDLVDPVDVEGGVLALFPDFLAASLGITPSSASASAAWASISNQMRNGLGRPDSRWTRIRASGACRLPSSR
jgi:hypothetical protein